MEYLFTVSWGSSIKKLHYINTNTLIHPILCGEPIYSLQFWDFFGQPLIQHWVPRGACVIKMGLNKGIQKQPLENAGDDGGNKNSVLNFWSMNYFTAEISIQHHGKIQKSCTRIELGIPLPTQTPSPAFS